MNDFGERDRAWFSTFLVLGLYFGLVSFNAESASMPFPTGQTLVYIFRYKEGSAIYRSLVDGRQRLRLSAEGESANWSAYFVSALGKQKN